MPKDQNRTNVHFSLKEVNYKIPYDQQPDCKRHVIGAYANLARHNLTLVVNTLMQAVGMKTYEEDDIADAFGPGHRKKLAKLDNIQKVNLQKRLYRHFTFLKRMKLEDKDKKSVQLETLYEVLSDFTSCASDIRNFYTHYRPYNTPDEIQRQQELKKRMGERLTYLFENSCQMFKKKEKLKHEENEVFYTQRERVNYSYYWFVQQDLPHNLSLADLILQLESSPNKKKTFGNIEYRLHEDGTISGLCRRNGVKHRYTWNFNETSSSGTYADLEKEMKDEIEKKQKQYEKDLEKGKNPFPVSTTTVKLKNVKCSFVGEKGIKREWSQFDRDPDYYATMSDPEKGLSDVGLLYFLCLFLDKSVAFELMEEVGFTRQCAFTADNDGENIDILQELMCLNRIRMVKSKLDSEMTETSLALDMLNEVRKCPKQLYEVFTKEARAEFKDDATVAWEAANQQEAVQTEDTKLDEDEAESDVQGQKETPKSTFVRWQDRFPQMALRYIDVRGLFEDIRFQLHLGKYRFAFYKHDSEYSIDGEERLRILQKELHGFGRIQEVDEKVKDLWKDLYEKRYEADGILQKEPDQVEQAPYVTQQTPQYAIDEKSHSIGLRWEGWDNGFRESTNDELKRQHPELDANKMFIPFLPANPSVPTDGSRQKNQAESLLSPQAMMSLYDLPGLLFYQYLLERNGQDFHFAEQLIIDCYHHLKAFFTDISEGKLFPLNYENGMNLKEDLDRILQEKYELRLSDIPEKLRKYLMSVNVDYDAKLKDSAYNRLQERRERVERALESYREKCKRIGTKDNKFDKMHATIKTGTLAQYLMRDIMDWLPQDAESRAKLTGQSYMALQTAIAMLGQAFEDEQGNTKRITLTSLREMMIKAKITDRLTTGIDQKRFHPFLHLVFRDCKVDSVERFYELYLEKEIKKIKNVESFLNEAKGDISTLRERYRYVPFLYHERLRWTNTDAQAMMDLASRYLERPLQLPDGLFTNKIYQFLQALPQKQVPQKQWDDFQVMLTKADEGEMHLRLSRNVSYLINLYFKYVENDHAQPFYITDSVADSTPSPYLHTYRVLKKYYGKTIGRTNQKTTPSYTIEELRKLLNDKATIANLIKEYVNKEVESYRDSQRKKFKKYEDQQWTMLKAEKLPSGKNKWSRPQIKEEVGRRMKTMKEEFEETIPLYRERLTKKQERMFRKVNDNERAIRRFKTQDILLLMMARQILKAKSPARDYESDFKLKYVMSDSLLNQPIDFEWDVYVKNSKGEKVKKTIKQKGMKMKDYGNFYKFLSDKKRVETLLSRLSQTSFLRSLIENEFSYYDSNRSAVFRLVYEIEYEAYKLCPMLKVDANSEPKEEGNSFYYKDKKSGKLIPKRNNFMSLLEILAAGEDGVLSDEEKRIMQSIRNSISHNTYEVDFEAVFCGREGMKKVPEIANGIKDRIETDTKQLRERISKKNQTTS